MIYGFSSQYTYSRQDFYWFLIIVPLGYLLVIQDRTAIRDTRVLLEESMYLFKKIIDLRSVGNLIYHQVRIPTWIYQQQALKVTLQSCLQSIGVQSFMQRAKHDSIAAATVSSHLTTACLELEIFYFQSLDQLAPMFLIAEPYLIQVIAAKFSQKCTFLQNAQCL